MDWSAIISNVTSLHGRKSSIEYVDAPEGFPYEKAYKEQDIAIKKIKDNKSVVLSSHTGSGKSAVFLTATRNESTVVIEPRKFLQKQIAEYFGDVILYGRSEYKCGYAHNADMAPCLKKLDCDETFFKDYCVEHATHPKACAVKKCKVFQIRDKPEIVFHKYPCNGCPFIDAQIRL